MMAGETVELRIFGPDLALRALRQPFETLAQLNNLSNAPRAHVLPRILMAPMARHRGTERFEIEYEIGMSGGDHFVIDGFIGAADVARGALLGAPHEIFRVVHAGGNRLRVRPCTCRMRPEPAARGSVTRLTADTFGGI